jgi:hypothetical protein
MNTKYECCQCGWTGLDSDKKRIESRIDSCMTDLVCPECNEESFYDLGKIENEEVDQSPSKPIQKLVDHLLLMKDDSGREGCTYGDTDYDSMSVVYGYNQAIDNVIANIKSLRNED